MRRHSKLFVPVASAILVALILVSPALARNESKVVVRNLSDWTIEEFYMSPTDVDHWGEDLLGDEVLEPGDTLTLTDVSCDEWDIQIIDEDGDECVLQEVDLCADHAIWKITNNELLGCIEDTDDR